MPDFTDSDILTSRPAKETVDISRPNAWYIEAERSPTGTIDDVATILLTNRECPFRCLMCDLWKRTIDSRVPVGTIPAQIDYALTRLPETDHIKLYNSGSFFDAQAIPPEDHNAIAERVGRFQTVIVENHPSLCGDACIEFQKRLDAQLEVAIGLEIAHPDILHRLNKKMTLSDFETAVAFLVRHGIRVRAFILLRPPWLTDEEGVDWAIQSITFAFSTGVSCCSVIPTRPGNGILDQMEVDGTFARPSLTAIETVLENGIQLGQGRVFMDLWDIEQFARCPQCAPARIDRLREMNWSQTTLPRVVCDCGSGPYKESSNENRW